MSKDDELFIKYSLESVDIDLWNTYYEIQQRIKEGGSNEQLVQQYQSLKQRK